MKRETRGESTLAFGAMMTPQPLAPLLLGPWKVREPAPERARVRSRVLVRAGLQVRRAARVLGHGLLCHLGILEFDSPMSAPLRQDPLR